MEVELVPLGAVPLGMVSSTLLYGAGSDGEQTEAPPSKASEVLVSLCSSGKLIAFISSYQAQFVTCEALPSVETGEVVSYQTSFEGLLHVVRDPAKQRPYATAVVTVPITFEARPGTPRHSSIVVVGFSDGFIRAYSKSGVSVLSQLLHPEPVVKITCNASSMAQRKTAAGQSNLVVLFRSVVCVVEGGSLVEVVRTNVAKWSEGGGEKGEPGGPALLSYRKWCLQGQTSTADITLLGQSTSSLYDHLCEASSEGGCETIIRGGPTPEARLITVGEQPMIALYRITKDAGTPNMSELVSAVASKMTSAVLGKLSKAGGWLGWGGSTTATAAAAHTKSPEEKMPVASNLQMSTSVPDSRRNVATITVSPLGNLAAAVDCFGRVLLVDCETLVVRRMWKGYRDAQCGWLLINEALPSPRVHSRSSRKRETAGSAGRKAQCLCIYASRRGMVELWPVQHGSRVAAFQVGKGCRLLYSPHGVFVSESDHKLLEGESGRKKGLKDTAVLLCPNGQMVSFSVPFPTLARVNDPSSHDAHLLQKLPQAVKSGDTELILQIISNIKSSQSMKRVVDVLISAHPLEDVSSDFTIKVLNLSLSRVDPTHQLLFQYIAGVRQLTQLLLGTEDLSSEDDHTPPSPDKLQELLTQLCRIPVEVSKNLSNVLRKYFTTFSAKRRVIKKVELKGFTGCFDLPEKVGNHVLSCEASGTNVQSEPVVLILKDDLSESTLLDTGCELFLPLLNKNVPEYDITTLFQKCGVSARTLLSLLCRVFLNGNLQETNPSVLLQRLHKIVTVITKLSEPAVGQQEAEVWPEVGLQCAHTHNVGHALLIGLLGQNVSGGTDSASQTGEEEEAWETVTAEREQWVRLIHHLEALTILSNTIGVDAMRRLPSVPFIVSEESDKAAEILDIGVLEVQLLQNVEKGGVSVAVLEASGPALIVHCVCQWLVKNQVSAEFVARIPDDPLAVVDAGHRTVVVQLGSLLKLLPHTLSHHSLLMHCTWQTACMWKDDPENLHLHHLLLQYISEISYIQLLKGMIGFLWYIHFEKLVVHMLDSLKRGTVSKRPGAAQVISVCRNMFGILYQMTFVSTEHEHHPPQSAGDVVVLPRPLEKRFLLDIVQGFPVPGDSLVKTYFELLLFTEIALQMKNPVNVVAFFPTWVRGALKKGIFLVAEVRQEQIPSQLQQKRVKFLCEAVGISLGSAGPKTVSMISSAALKQHTSATIPNIEVSEIEDFIFLLAELWELDIDNIKRHWVLNLFACGHGDHGREVFLGISDKSKVSQELLSLAGCLTDHLIHAIQMKSEKLALIAQIPPSFLEWLHHQSSVAKAYGKIEPTWKAVAQLVTLIQPYLTQTHASSIVKELSKVIHISYSQD